MGIRTKFATFAVAIVLLNGLVAHRFIKTAATDYLLEHTRAAALQSAARIAHHVAPFIAAGDRTLATQAFEVLSYDGETLDAGMFDARGRPIIPMRFPPPNGGACDKTESHVDPSRVWACAAVEWRGTRIGAVFVVRNTSAAEAQEDRVHAAASTLIPLFTAMVILALVLLVERVICGPLRRLTAVSTVMGEGQFPPAALITSNDEIGALTRAFDSMVQKLRDAALTRSQLITQLEDSRDAAEAGVRAKTEFLANISHEIRTPMNGIFGMTQLLLASDLSQEQRENIETLQASAERLMRLVDNLLDFSKLDVPAEKGHQVPFRLHECVESALPGLTLQAAAKALTLEWQTEAGLPEIVVGDPVRLRQIVVHLVENAIKFTEHGGVTVVTRAHEIGRKVELFVDVTDTGIGIAPQDRAAVFEPFQQADGSMTRRYGGTGLGLALSKRIAKDMGGDITFRSDVGRGSTFMFSARFQLPQDAVIGSSDLISLRDAVDASECAAGAGQRVLVVEDNRVNRKLILAFAQRLGLPATAVVNGAEAVARVRSEGFGLVLMDCQMPVMDGYEATRQIRAMEQRRTDTRHLCIIAITANAMPGDRERCLAAGMDDYLAKPLRFERFRNKVLRWIPAARSTDEPRSLSGTDPCADGSAAIAQAHRPA